MRSVVCLHEVIQAIAKTRYTELNDIQLTCWNWRWLDWEKEWCNSFQAFELINLRIKMWQMFWSSALTTFFRHSAPLEKESAQFAKQQSNLFRQIKTNALISADWMGRKLWMMMTMLMLDLDIRFCCLFFPNYNNLMHSIFKWTHQKPFHIVRQLRFAVCDISIISIIILAIANDFNQIFNSIEWL